MLVLSATTSKLQLTLGAAHTTNASPIVCSWRDITTTDYTPGSSQSSSNGTSAVDIVAAPGSSTQRVVDHINFYNKDTVAHTVTVAYDDNGTDYELWSGTVVAGGVLTYVEGAGWSTSGGSLGYCLNVGCVNTGTWTDSQTVYIGGRWGNATTTAGSVKVRVPKSGTIKGAYVHSFSTTAGTGEAWPAYVRLNNSSDTLIDTVSLAAGEREWKNASLSIPVVADDYIEIKFVNPAWATNPANMTVGGHIYIE